MERILPAYPLWVIDPLFSVWAKTEALNGDDTVFWTGQSKRACGFVRWNGKTYCFMGRYGGALPLEQTDVRVSAFSTDYTFRGEGFTLGVRFVSPLLPDDLKTLACPVCYTDYEVRAEGELPADFSVALMLDEEFCYNGERAAVAGGVLPLKGYEAAYFTRARNLVLSDTSDFCSPDWGDIYLAAEESWFVSESAVNGYLRDGKAAYVRKNCERQCLLGVNRAAKGTFMTAFDDKVSIFYFGEWLKGYFFRNGKTIIDALGYARKEHGSILAKCGAFDEALQKDCAAVGEGYYTLACAALRQSVGAHKLVETRKGELLFLSKENDSNGCIGTADVSYPSIPLYLLYNPELVNGMLRGIFDFAKMPVWTFGFAPHDVGTYPWCAGQVYGTAEREDKYCCGRFTEWNAPRTNQMLYLRPAASDVYNKDLQMPVEECGNMLIMTAAALRAGADKKLAKQNFSLLKKWVKYLEKFGLRPENQLCTDDFAGHLAGNVNLSLKASASRVLPLSAAHWGRKGLPRNTRTGRRSLPPRSERRRAKGSCRSPTGRRARIPSNTISCSISCSGSISWGKTSASAKRRIISNGTRAAASRSTRAKRIPKRIGSCGRRRSRTMRKRRAHCIRPSCATCGKRLRAYPSATGIMRIGATSCISSTARSSGACLPRC